MAASKEYRRLSDGAVVELTDAQFEVVKDLFVSASSPVGLGSPLQQQRERTIAAKLRDETLAYIEEDVAAQQAIKDAKAATEHVTGRERARRALNERKEAAARKALGEDQPWAEKPPKEAERDRQNKARSQPPKHEPPQPKRPLKRN